MEVRKALIKLYNRIDFSRGEVLRILEVSQWIKIVIDESNLKIIDELFTKQDILSIDKKLGEISLIYSEEVINVPGIFAVFASELALRNISIRDGVICGGEHILIIKDDELMVALDAIYQIAKWGEKN